MSTGLEERYLKRLELFGLTRLQARVYVSSHVLGEVTARRIVDSCHIQKVEAYRILTELERLGVVDRIIAHPARYRARPPEEVLKTLLLPKVERLAELGEAKAEVLGWLRSLKKYGSGGGVREGFEILHDRLALKRAAEMLDRAQESVFYVARAYEDKIRGGVMEAFNRAIRRGVTAKGVLRITDEDRGLLKLLDESPLVSRRHSDLAYSWNLIVDGEEAIFGSAPVVLPDEEFLYTRNRRFIGHLIRSFELLYEEAVPIGRRIRELWGPRRPAAGGLDVRTNK